MTSEEQVRAVVDRHLAGVAAADADALAALYDEHGFFEDPVGGQRHEGRAAVREHFAAALQAPREVHLVSIAVVGTEVAVLFRAVAADGTTTEVFDVMSFTDQGHIACTRAYWPAGAGDAAPSEPDAGRPSTRRPGPPGSR